MTNVQGNSKAPTSEVRTWQSKGGGWGLKLQMGKSGIIRLSDYQIFRLGPDKLQGPSSIRHTSDSDVKDHSPSALTSKELGKIILG
jgi:hypothetical protein